MKLKQFRVAHRGNCYWFSKVELCFSSATYLTCEAIYFAWLNYIELSCGYSLSPHIVSTMYTMWKVLQTLWCTLLKLFLTVARYFPVWGIALFTTTVFLDRSHFARSCSTHPSQSSKYTEGVAQRMSRCIAIQRLSRKCVQKWHILSWEWRHGQGKLCECGCHVNQKQNKTATVLFWLFADYDIRLFPPSQLWCGGAWEWGYY